MVLCLKAWESRTLPGLLNVKLLSLYFFLSKTYSLFMKICVVGSGYVGLSLAVLISQKYNVCCLDVSEEKVSLINKKESPFKDAEVENFLKNKNLNLKATLEKREAYNNAKIVIVATPTNYNIDTGSFDTSNVEGVINDCLNINKEAIIVIKSTIPIGFTDLMRSKFKTKNIFFSPEFLRESKALYDNLYPSRIVVGDLSDIGKEFANILIECSEKTSSKIPLLFMESKEAEAVKLFSNTFLAMRISFFNELDSFAEVQKLSTKKNYKRSLC